MLLLQSDVVILNKERCLILGPVVEVNNTHMLSERTVQFSALFSAML